MHERITQLKEEIAGLLAQQQAKDQEIALVTKELVGVRALYDQHLVQITRLSTLERDVARLAGERAQYVASKAQAKGKITETELQIIQVDKDMVSDVSKDLRESNDKIGEFVDARSRPRISCGGSTSAPPRTAWWSNRPCTPSAA